MNLHRNNFSNTLWDTLEFRKGKPEKQTDAAKETMPHPFAFPVLCLASFRKLARLFVKETKKF